MGKFVAVMMYALWIISLLGVLVITFTNFQYFDLNVIVVMVFCLTLLNTYFTVKKRR